jgi:hypothetical protein
MASLVDAFGVEARDHVALVDEAAVRQDLDEPERYTAAVGLEIQLDLGGLRRHEGAVALDRGADRALPRGDRRLGRLGLARGHHRVLLGETKRREQTDKDGQAQCHSFLSSLGRNHNGSGNARAGGARGGARRIILRSPKPAPAGRGWRW